MALNVGILEVTDYDEMPVFVADGLSRFVAAAARGAVREGLSIAFVFGERVSRDVIAGAADVAAKLAPVVVHCFGTSSEEAHDAVDAALEIHGGAGIPTAWTVEFEPADVIFELFCTDLPTEEDFDRWSGRLFILDQSLDRRTRDCILNGLQNIDATIQLAVRGESK